MKIGHGVDIVELEGFKYQLELPGSTFIGKVFTDLEISQSPKKIKTNKRYTETLAGKWASKESFIKAWSNLLIGIAPILSDNNWQEIEVLKDLYSRPYIKLSGFTKQKFEEQFPNSEISLSISHDGNYAIASVIIYCSKNSNSSSADLR
ncbi:MAG: holo-ACP synthase [Candidatus Ancillula sp.]|jgi:holo-[acyl-carrier protein] synthase|nr:holo-ACP synthase [Candidatus Ancillula sp.]